MDPDMSIRNRNALGLFRLISASYDMLPPFSHPVEDIPGCGIPDRGRSRDRRAVASAPALRDVLSRRYRRAGASLEADARTGAGPGRLAGGAGDAVATCCPGDGAAESTPSAETWRSVDIEANRPDALSASEATPCESSGPRFRRGARPGSARDP